MEGETEHGERWTPCPIDTAHSDFANGLIAVALSYCMPPWTGTDVPEVWEVCASGVFWVPAGTDAARPLDIIKELLRHYCGIPYNGYMFNQTEIENEIGGLAPVGIVYGEEMGVFEAIETLQDASNLGFQFKTGFNRFTARRDDNDRPVSDTITMNDLVDIAKVEIDMNRENYATIIDVAFNRSWYHDTAQHYEGKTNRFDLLTLYDVDRVYAPASFLLDKASAKDKADRLEKFFRLV